MRKANRHAEWHDLLEAQRAGGCAICSLVDRASRRYLAALLHESVNDPGIRQELRAAGGFCAHHVAFLLERPDVLGLAILAQDVVSEIASHLERRLASLPDRAQSKPCPACAAAGRAERDFLSTLAENLNDPQLRACYGSGSGLCIPHLAQATALAAADGRAWLIDTERELLQALAAELREVVRKNDYRFHDEPWGRERDSWRRALLKLSGLPGRKTS